MNKGNKLLKVSFTNWLAIAFLIILPFSINFYFVSAETGTTQEENTLNTSAAIEIRVGVYENPPKVYYSENEGWVGIFPDLLKYIAEIENWELTFISGTWNKGLSRLSSGQIDIMVDVGYSDERAELYEFGNESVLTNWGVIYAGLEEQIDNILDLEGKSVGVLENDINYIGPYGIRNLVLNFNVNCSFIEYQSLHQVLEAVDNNTVDAGVVNHLFGTFQASNYAVKETAIYFNPISFFYAFPINGTLTSMLLQTIDSHLHDLKQDSNSIYHSILGKYIGRYNDQESIFPTWLKFVLIGLLITSVLFFGISILFRYQVQKKTKFLEEDILERTKIEKKLIDSQAKFRTLFEQSPLGFLELDFNCNLLDINPAGEKILNISREEILGKNIDFLDEMENNPDSPEIKIGGKVRASRDNLQMLQFISQLQLKNESVFCNFIIIPLTHRNNEFLSLFILLQDITARIKQERINLREQKIESLSYLAGGIAHDFNNMLSSLLGNVNLMQIDENIDRIAHDNLANMEEIINVAKGLSRQLLTFAKGGEPVKKPENIVEILSKAVDFSMHGSNCTHRTIFPTEPIICNLDVNQISQVFNNLILNAQQAMPLGGEIIFSVEKTAVTEIANFTKSNREHVKISIRDHGVGMSEEVKKKIFEPYFSTKPNGTGLGLATCYSIIKQHDGIISFNSKPNEGTEFSVYLPIYKYRKENTKPSDKMRASFSGNILIMDDDAAVRTTLKGMLEHLGFSVETTEDGEEVVKKYLEKMEAHEEIDLIILDLTVPGKMGGEEAIKHLRQINPEVRAVVSSGYSKNPVMANYHNYGFINVLPKPFSLKELIAVLNEVFTL